MSEKRTEITAERNVKKQVLSIVLIAILLFGIYLGSTALFNLLFGSLRPAPSDKLEDAPAEDADLYTISIDLLDLLDLLNYDDLLKHASEPVFYIEDYDPYDDSWLWRFSVMDEYASDGSWSQSVSGKSPTSFTSWNDYWNYYSDRDILKIKMPIDVNSGSNSLTIPTLFPTPHVIQNSPQVDPWTSYFDLTSPILYKDIFNVTSIELTFYDSYSGNLTYELFGKSVMSPNELNISAELEIYTPSSIKDQYYQMPDPGGIPGYIQNHPNFQKHYNALDAIINYTDNTYVKANKIRNYLQANFELEFIPRNRPAEGVDVVEWFCGNEAGIFSDFAATYTLFTRAFGIASRYVDGFNSRRLPFYQNEFYNSKEGKNYTIIRRANLYSWCEIYIPLAINGSGVWTEMDLLFESFGDGIGGEGNQVEFGDTNLYVYTNTTAPLNRGDSVEISAVLYMGGVPQEGITIDFTDATENIFLGQSTTNIYGSCSIITNIYNNTVAGPHLIEATTGLNINYTAYFLYAPIEIYLNNVIPTYIDKTVSNSTRISGELIDPQNGKGISDGEVEYILLDLSNNRTALAFTPDFEFTDNNGEYDTDVIVNDNVISGNYSVRVDFNGSFHIEGPFGEFYQDFSYPLMNDSSSTINVTIQNPYATFLDLYIDDFYNVYPNNDYFNPRVNRYNGIDLKAVLYSQVSGPINFEEIIFYDITEGTPGAPLEIGKSYTDFNGEAIINYYLGYYKITGPHLIYAEWGSLKNYSYFILDENVRIDLNPPRPIPNTINRSGSIGTTFNINGSIKDEINNNSIKYSLITVKLFRNTLDYSSYLQPILPSTNPYYCGVDGTFNLNFDVQDNIPPGNYSIRVDFNGTFDYTSQDYPYFYDLPYINTSTSAVMDLKIEAPDIFIFNFWINGSLSSEYEQPIVKRNQMINLTAYLQLGIDPIVGETVTFFDVTNNSLIGVRTTDLNGYVNITYNLSIGSIAAGPHLIYANYQTYFNYSYFILNESIYVDLISGPTPPTINRSGSYNTIFNLHGYIKDKFNDMNIQNCIVNFRMFDGAIEVYYLDITSYDCGSSGEFNINFEVDDFTPAKNYTLIIGFSGSFNYLSSPYPYYFSLSSFSNFVNSTQGFQELKVLDPEDVMIEFWINGTETSVNYNGANPPWTFKRNECVNFTARVYQSGIPQNTSSIYIYDSLEDNGNPISYKTPVNGYAQFIFMINDTWVAGPHKIRVQWSSFSTSNYTYIVINETVKVEIDPDPISAIRNVDWITISGFVNDTITISNPEVKYVELNIKLFNKSMDDCSSYLNFDMGYSSPMVVQGPNWNYEFRFQVDLSIPHGEYYIRVDFNGSIRDYTGPVFIDLNNYMISKSSELKPLNVSATTTIINGYYDTISDEEDVWYVGEIIKINGTLLYDNGSAVVGALMNITLEDPYGTILTFNATKYTDSSGYFYVEITIDEGWDPEKIFATSVINNIFIIDTIRLELPRS